MKVMKMKGYNSLIFKLLLLLAPVSQSYPVTSHEQTLITGMETGGVQELFDGFNYCYNHSKDLECSLTQTGIHLKNNLFGLQDYVVKQYANNSDLLKMANEVIEKERNYKQKGFYTFVHGQKRGYLLPEKMYTFLWQIHEQCPADDFLFAHVKPLLTSNEKTQEAKLRAHLLKHGRKQGDAAMRQKLLFLNYGLFGNLKDSSSSTAHYVASNVNFGSSPISITTKDAFNFLGYQNVYSKYQTEIEALEKDYAVSSHGTILLVAVPQKDIEKYVYLCSSGSSGSGMGGVKRSISIKGIGKTDDIKLIMKAIIENPTSLDSDDLEFCLIMTQDDGGLDPKTGIKIEPIISGDKNALAKLQEREKELYKKIKKEIEG
jgi:hypothetical protein